MINHAPTVAFDLKIVEGQVTGPHSGVDDIALCVDTAEALAGLARGWALPGGWSGTAGFDSEGSFELIPVDSGALSFKRRPRSFGWLKDPLDDLPEDSFVISEAKAMMAGSMDWPDICREMGALPGFLGCALRHPQTGLWKPVVDQGKEKLFARFRSLITPMLKILRAQGLPYGRCLVSGEKANALIWRTPNKVVGYLHLTKQDALAQAEALVDAALLASSNQ